MVESQVARVGPYHRDAYSGIGHFEPALHNVRSISTLVNHLVTPSQDEYLVRNQPDLVRNFMSAISFVPILHKSVSKLPLISQGYNYRLTRYAQLVSIPEYELSVFASRWHTTHLSLGVMARDSKVRERAWPVANVKVD